MRYLLLASHGNLAEGMLDSLEMITGHHDNIFVISAYKNDESDFKSQLKSVLAQISISDELIIITDIFGGSVNNESLKIMNDKRVHLIAGLNLALVIELVTRMNSNIFTDELIESSLKNAKDTMIYCNLISQKKTKDEDF
ncbi:PTS sugar transporter subunit IIA [Virgibacillus halophilus]|uniref:PTS sugar transporter subunit IIA n=1 Tax=Tigheibacillus halophilus TaxID=361280 RepID=UPI0036270578